MHFTDLSLLLLVCCCTAHAVAHGPPPKEIKDPKICVSGGGSPKTGYNVNADVRKNVWESKNGRHAFDVTGGYSQHLGGPYGNSRPDYRAGGAYTFRF